MSASCDSRFLYVWSGENFPFVNLLSVVSVMRCHPNSRIEIFVINREPDSKWFKVLDSFANVHIEIVSPDDIFSHLPSNLHYVSESFRHLPENALSAKSNLLRYALLYLRGGIYLDFDVLILRSMDELMSKYSFVGEEMVWASDVKRLTSSWILYLSPANILWAVSHGAMWIDSQLFGGRFRTADRLKSSFKFWATYQLNNAVMGSTPRSDFLFEILKGVADANLDIRYSTGPTLVEQTSRTTEADVLRLGETAFYCIPPGQTYRLFFDRTFKIPDEAFGVHFAASNHEKFVNSFSPERLEMLPQESAMGRLIGELIQTFNKLTSNMLELSQR